MKFIIKAKPEDFVVEELAELPLADTGEYAVFRLTKRGWNTTDVLRSLSRQMRLPSRSFGYGGRKDRHAQTTQYITICSPNPFQTRSEMGRGPSVFSLKFLGRMAHPMSPSFILGNKFSIMVRDLSAGAVQRALSRVTDLTGRGFPNYFDDQRFGSYDTMQGFLGEKVLKGHFNGALKIYLTKEQVSDKPADRARKRLLYKHWGEWGRCRAAAVTAYEKEVFDYLAAHPKGFLDILRGIPHEEITVYFSAYQSFLWNEILRRLLVSCVPLGMKRYAGTAGEYLFPLSWEGADYQYLSGCAIPLPGIKVSVQDKRVNEIYAQVLGAHGIRQGMFNAVRLRQAFYKSLSRSVLVIPGGFHSDISDDEMYAGRRKMLLHFTLPRGSYATMLLKRLFVD